MASSSQPVPDSELNPPDAKHPRTENGSEEEDEWEMLNEDIYTQQHFATNADEIVDSIFNISLEHLTALIPSLKASLMELQCMSKSEDETAVAAAKVDAGLAKYVEYFYKTLQRNSDALLLYLKKNIISIPDKNVLPQDQVQITYEELVKSLQTRKKICGDADEPDYTIENTADRLTEKAANLHNELLKKRIEKVKLEYQISLADGVLKRLGGVESAIDSSNEQLLGSSVREYILSHISAVVGIPFANGAKMANGSV